MQLDTREFRAEARFQRVSPQKARLVLELIKGRRVEEALQTVAFTKKGVAPLVEKVLRSALQNANYLSQEQGLDVDVDNLYVKTAVANDGPRMKRIRPAPMGRAFRYQRRLSHILISVAERKLGGLVTTVEPGTETAGQRVKTKAAAKTAKANKASEKKTVAKKTAAKSAAKTMERPGNKLRLIIRTARPGIVIGRKGAEIEKLKGELQKRTNRDVFIDILEVNKPELDAQLVSENIALQLEKRVGFRRAMRKSVDSALRFGCKGIKVRVSGRLNGNEIARSEWYLQGRLPLHTLRADIDYGFSEAHTTYGIIGVKCWIYKGDIYEQKRRQPQQVGTTAF